ncbi:MAG: cobalt transporter [Lentisphaerae bacterium GWF2_38_69]|nr:MAG: cobalt transporter [Lentisphaerae bacterium GWF2_38_69]
MLFTIILNLIIGAAEVIGGIFSGSLSLISDALHNFSDALAIIISYIAIKISKITQTEGFTFGFKRAEILAALINASALLVISIFLIWEAIERFYEPNTIGATVMFIVALIGLIANILGALLLRADSKNSLNLKSAYLHLFSDAVTSVAVILGAICIHYWRIYWLDPLLTIAISIYILIESFKILKHTLIILMMGKPDHISLTDVKTALEAISEIDNIHHCHLWMLTDKLFHFEAHIDINNINNTDTDKILHKAEQILKDKFGITHSTLQIEKSRCDSKELLNHV